MNLMWMFVGLGIVCAALVVLSAWHRGRHRSDLGQLSDQWMAEQRMNHGSDQNR